MQNGAKFANSVDPESKRMWLATLLEWNASVYPSFPFYFVIQYLV